MCTGVDFKVKKLQMSGKKIKATIWDTGLCTAHASRQIYVADCMIPDYNDIDMQLAKNDSGL